MAENVWSRIFKTGLSNIILAGIILLMLAFTVGVGTAQPDHSASVNTKDDDNITPYDGPIGPDNALYGLKIAFEDFDESFTFNASEKLQKKIAHANLRLAEAEGQLKKRNAQAAERALERFNEKNTEADDLISSSSDINSGLLHAEEMIKKHQQILYNLTQLHPDNPGLARAYSNSLELEQKFNRRVSEREARGEHNEENVAIKAEIFDNNTEVKVSVNFKSVNVTNFSIANEILDKFQLSAENINTLLTVENMDDGELNTELGADAKIEDGFSIINAEYKFPLLNTTSKDGIVDGIYMNLHALTIENVTNTLEIENMTKVSENKKDEKAAIKQAAHEIKDEKQKEKEQKQEEKTAIKQERRENNGRDR
ncbi:Uncharacterised protein [uncultured archaeon]|nr:Uncharacterised protein [uncultured archaeon]